MNYGIEIFFLFCVIIPTAFWQRHLIRHNIPIYHTVWAVVYALLVFVAWLIAKDPILILALIVEREVFFSPFLNLIREKKFFYTNPGGTNASKMDYLLGEFGPYVWGVSVLALVIFNLYL